jgi:hypothetical protein
MINTHQILSAKKHTSLETIPIVLMVMTIGSACNLVHGT